MLLVLCCEPKPEPVIVTVDPAGAMLGEMPVIVAGEANEKVAPGLVMPCTVTVMGPLVAPEGTPTVMLVLLQLVMEVAVTPLNFTEDPATAAAVKPEPVRVTYPPTGAAGGDTAVMTGL